MMNHAQRDHALLSASGANRWLNCPPSARLEDTLPDEISVYAEEGTLAHEIAELKLRRLAYNLPAQDFNNQLNVLRKHELFQKEMLTHADTYYDYIYELCMQYLQQPLVAVEQRLDYSVYVPEGFGTVDCLAIAENTLHVIDYKYGKGVPVSAEKNSQMMLYAIAAYLKYSFLYTIKQVEMTIVQPRLNNISRWCISLEDLLAWGESIKPLAQQAFAEKGEFKPGDHCKFCKAKAQCRARAEEYSAVIDLGLKKPPLLSNDEIGELIEKAQGVDKWYGSLKDHALKECLKGNAIKGWKAVEGRGSRGYTDIDAAFRHLQVNGINEAVLYERVPLTAPKLEKALGKTEFNSLIGAYVVKTPGKPTLAPESDKRALYQAMPSARDDFNTP